MQIKILNYELNQTGITYIIKTEIDDIHLLSAIKFSDLVRFNNKIATPPKKSSDSDSDEGKVGKIPSLPKKMLIHPSNMSEEILRKRSDEIEEYLNSILLNSNNPVKEELLQFIESFKMKEAPIDELSVYDINIFVDESFVKNKKKLKEILKSKKEQPKKKMGFRNWMQNVFGCCQYK